MVTFEERLIEFDVSMSLESLSDTIYDSLRSVAKILNETGKKNADKISLLDAHISGIEKGLEIGSRENIKGNDVLIIRYIRDSIISKYRSGLVSADGAWSNLLELLDI